MISILSILIWFASIGEVVTVDCVGFDSRQQLMLGVKKLEKTFPPSVQFIEIPSVSDEDFINECYFLIDKSLGNVWTFRSESYYLILYLGEELEFILWKIKPKELI
jgi:hypothetical protein